MEQCSSNKHADGRMCFIDCFSLHALWTVKRGLKAKLMGVSKSTPIVLN